MIEEESGFTLFWVGKPKGERREGRVGFAIRTSLVKQVEQPTSINDRIMKMMVPLSCRRYLSMLSVYAPTLNVPWKLARHFTKLFEIPILPSQKMISLCFLETLMLGCERTMHATWNAVGRHGSGKISKLQWSSLT